MKYAISRLFAIVFCVAIMSSAMAQPDNNPDKRSAKPYRILTSGKQVTVRSSKNIRNIMVWTASGHRIVEQKDVNAATYTFNVSAVRDKAFFVMIQFDDGKPFTEKIGVQ